jgi:soluble lytic murein transglycosylase-like protein
MTTLIISPIVAVTLVSVAQPLASRSTAAAGAQQVSRVQGRIAPLIVTDLRSPVTDPPSAAPTAAPTAAPKPPARPRVVAPPIAAGPPADPNSVIGIIEAAAARWGVSGSWMVKIARCESGLRPNAYNPRGPYVGLFQFLQSTFTHNGGTNIYDAADQANIAAKMLANGQAHQWSCA